MAVSLLTNQLQQETFIERKLRSVSAVNVFMYIHIYSKDIPIYYVTVRSDAHIEEDKSPQMRKSFMLIDIVIIRNLGTIVFCIILKITILRSTLCS